MGCVLDVEGCGCREGAKEDCQDKRVGNGMARAPNLEHFFSMRVRGCAQVPEGRRVKGGQRVSLLLLCAWRNGKDGASVRKGKVGGLQKSTPRTLHASAHTNTHASMLTASSSSSPSAVSFALGLFVPNLPPLELPPCLPHNVLPLPSAFGHIRRRRNSIPSFLPKHTSHRQKDTKKNPC